MKKKEGFGCRCAYNTDATDVAPAESAAGSGNRDAHYSTGQIASEKILSERKPRDNALFYQWHSGHEPDLAVSNTFRQPCVPPKQFSSFHKMVAQVPLFSIHEHRRR